MIDLTQFLIKLKKHISEAKSIIPFLISHWICHISAPMSKDILVPAFRLPFFTSSSLSHTHTLSLTLALFHTHTHTMPIGLFPIVEKHSFRALTVHPRIFRLRIQWQISCAIVYVYLDWLLLVTCQMVRNSFDYRWSHFIQPSFNVILNACNLRKKEFYFFKLV